MTGNAFQPGDEWLEFEQGGLHEQRPDLIQDVDVIMPKLRGENFWVAAAIQKYRTSDDKVRWRSLTPKRDIFRSGYTSRERCAQELVKECPAVVEVIGWRRAFLARSAT